MGEKHPGLFEDLFAMRAIDRRAAMRQALRLAAGAALIPLVPAACSDSDGGTAADSAGGMDTGGVDTGGGVDTTVDTVDTVGAEVATDTGVADTGGAEAVTSCEPIPSETEGPFPGDGSNGPNALTLADVVRKDIRSSIGTLSGTAAGVQLTLRLRVVDADDGCAPLAGYAVYIWHCDRDGDYSMYNNTSQNYLRGVQVADADGYLEFVTVFPGCYQGRWPHIHFEVYASVGAISSANNAVRTSQLAFDESVCDAVYATSGYEASVANLAGLSLSSDGIFRDGVDLQLAATSGDVASGLTSELLVAV